MPSLTATTSNASVQVMLFSDRLEVWNPGELAAPLTVARLRQPHASIPRNPLIAEPMFLARYAEKAGTGILDMIAQCRAAGLPAPEFRQDGGQFVQTLGRPLVTVTPEASPEVAPPVTQPVTPPVTPPVEVLARLLDRAGALGNAEIRPHLGLRDRAHLRQRYIDPALADGLIEPTIPDKPNSRLQQYRLTPKGRVWLDDLRRDKGEA